jgi:hypothetical protein
MRHIYTWGQAADVSKKMIQRNLSKGHSLAMCPGGAHEVSYSVLVSVVLHRKYDWGPYHGTAQVYYVNALVA